MALVAILTLSTPGLQSLAQTTTQTSQSSAQPSSLQLTIYADGSIGVSYSTNETNTAAPGTIPDSNFQVSFPASAGGSTVTINGSATLPANMTSQAPYNYSSSISISGTYSSGVSQGEISVQAVPGIESPLTSFKLGYNGNANSVSVNGSATVQYGPYQNGTIEENINQSTIAHLLTVFQSKVNSSYLDTLLAQLPYANLTVSQYTLKQINGTNSATVLGNLTISGNITAIPAALAAFYLSSGIAGSQLPITCSGQQVCGASYSAFGAIFSSVQSYSYTATYSNGVAGLQATLQASQNFNLEKALQILGASSNSTSTSQQYSILNSTRYRLSGLTGTFSENQMASGEYTEVFQVSGLTIYPPYVKTGNELNMSSLFELFNNSGTFPGTVTMLGGSNSNGTVSLVIPNSVPTPESSTAQSASWTSVQLSQLGGVGFTVSGPVVTTTTTSSVSSQSTTSSVSSQSTSSTTSSTTSSGGNSGISESVVLGIVILVVVVIVAVYFVVRRTRRPNKS